MDDEKGVSPIRLTPSLVEQRGFEPPTFRVQSDCRVTGKAFIVNVFRKLDPCG